MRPSCLVTVLALAYACAERPKALHTSRRSSSVTCGDVARDTSHRAFAAIERLATTRDEVRILVYGQSISEQSWWLDVRTWLRAQYPEGTLRMEEHARGGCSAQCLIGREPWDQDGQRHNRVPRRRVRVEA